MISYGKTDRRIASPSGVFPAEIGGCPCGLAARVPPTYAEDYVLSSRPDYVCRIGSAASYGSSWACSGSGIHEY